MTRRLIVNADDYGLCDAVDDGIREAAARGIVSSVTAFAARVTPRSLDALRAAAPSVGVGLHVDLTDDLRTARRGDEAARVRDQMARFCDVAGRPPDHVDCHKHLHRGAPAALDALAALGVPVRADSARVRAVLRRRGIPCADHFAGDVGPHPWWTARRVAAALRALAPGTTEWMCHPGRSDGIPPSLTYREQRVVELRALTAAGLRDRLAARGVELVTFASLVPGGRPCAS